VSRHHSSSCYCTALPDSFPVSLHCLSCTTLTSESDRCNRKDPSGQYRSPKLVPRPPGHELVITAKHQVGSLVPSPLEKVSARSSDCSLGHSRNQDCVWWIILQGLG
jgi:hypothetical protein